MRFRKLPVEVEVVEQVDEQTEVETPEGFIEAEPDDIILRGVHGEKYPIKPAIFAKTYVPAEPDDLDAFRFYERVSPEGVQILTESQNGRVEVTGVHVQADDLGPDEQTRAREFARELSRVLGLRESPDAEETEGEP